jgi:hypothetical protein
MLLDNKIHFKLPGMLLLTGQQKGSFDYNHNIGVGSSDDPIIILNSIFQKRNLLMELVSIKKGSSKGG